MRDENRPSTSWRRVVLAVLAVLVLLGAWLWWGGSPPRVEGPVHLRRDAQGILDRTPIAEALSASGLSVRVGVQRSQINTTRTVSRTAGAIPYFRCRSILILNQSDHDLMHRVGVSLLESLTAAADFDQIDYFPRGTTPEPGTLGPDLLVRLELGEERSSGFLTDDLHAVVRARFGTALAASGHWVRDLLTSPGIAFAAELEVLADSAVQGVESSSAEYELFGREIGTAIADGILEVVHDENQQTVPIPPLPAEFHPPWREVPPLAFLTPDADRLYGFRGLMLANQSFWHLPAQDAAADLFPRIIAQLQGAGWTVAASEVDPGHLQHLRLKCGSTLLELFPADEDGYFVRYSDRMNPEERARARAALLVDPDASAEALLMFAAEWSDGERARVRQRLTDQPPRTPFAWVALARLHHDDGDGESAVLLLRCADLLARVQGREERIESALRDLMGELDLDPRQLPAPDREILLRLGFGEIGLDGHTAAVEIHPDESAGFFALAGEIPRVVAVHLHPRRRPEGDCFDVETIVLEGGRMSTTHHDQELQSPLRKRVSAASEGYQAVVERSKEHPERFVVHLEPAAR